MRDGIDGVLNVELCAAKTFDKMDVFFRLFSNLGHRRNGFHRVFSRRSLAGEHDRACSVIHRVGNIRNFRACRPRIMNHAFEHLRSGNDAFSKQPAFRNEIFLNVWQLLKRNLHAEISPADHDAFTFLANLMNVMNAGAIFDLCDNSDILSAVFGKKRLKIQ
ncbi:hypothetical protein SDC9_141882 [bioreactor metagenome]|uniref:Uncharacterized protein n=1 Tax=bioreactor metagenome TaxID=1076179 RepID=A0A645DYY6_9ZZZZ